MKSSLLLKKTALTSLLFLSLSLCAQEPDFAWVKRFGSPVVKANGGIIAIDAGGNSYVSAPLASFSPFTLNGITIQAGNEYISGGYIAKYNPQGQIVWAKPTTGITTQSDYNTDKIIIDASGNIYIAGDYFSGLDTNINGFVLSTFDVNNQSIRNLFLAKLNANGEVLWVKTAVASPDYHAFNPGNDIHFDLDGNINMTGTFRGFIQFSPAPALTHDEAESAVFLTKYSPEGNVVFSRKLEGALENPEESYITTSNSEQVKPDSYGNLYRWSNGAENTGVHKLYRYNAQGDLLGTTTLNYAITPPPGYPNYNAANLPGFAVDSQGNVFVAGAFWGANITIGNNFFYQYGNAVTNSDGLVIKLSAPDYEVEWVHHEELSTADKYSKLVADGLGNVYAAGSEFTGNERRIPVKKFSNSGELLWQKTIQGVYSQTQPLGIIDAIAVCQANNGGNVWISGNFDKNVYFDATAHFICPTGNTNHWNGFLVQYGTCNTEQPEVATPQVTQLCEGETLQLSASFSNPALSYKWNTGATTEDITVSQPGTYYVIAQESDECYGKSQEIHITAFPAPDAAITFSGGTLTAAANDAQYQWINCATQDSVTGATNQNFTPTSAGSYAVEITAASGCTVVSDCRTVTEDDLGTETLPAPAFLVYPNPVKDILYIDTPAGITGIAITNVLGQTVFSGTGKQADVSALPSGHYLLKATAQSGTHTVKFIKE